MISPVLGSRTTVDSPSTVVVVSSTDVGTSVSVITSGISKVVVVSSTLGDISTSSDTSVSSVPVVITAQAVATSPTTTSPDVPMDNVYGVVPRVASTAVASPAKLNAT